MPSQTHLDSEVLIVGAGLSGLAAARALAQAGYRGHVIDKGSSVGGRLATRRIAGGLADHGAQFFTARSEVWKAQVAQWQSEGLVTIWSNGFSDGKRPVESFDGHPRFVTREGMNRLAKRLAVDVGELASFHLDTRIVSVEPLGNGWLAVAESGTRWTAPALLLTAPVPQSLALLGDAAGRMSSADRDALTRIVYAPCVAGLFAVGGGTRLPHPGALQRPDAEITWIADNQRKGISPGARIITLHAGTRLSQSLWDQSEATGLQVLSAELSHWLEPGTAIHEAHLKRWRYAQPIVTHPERCLLASGLSPLVFAGDAFGESRVEGAYLSGLAAAAALIEALSQGHGLSFHPGNSQPRNEN
ncbi:MAG: FAD-dependent oxidoreductase [Anaerolineae bacterium]|nr:FAD-dependent oxidoreductase [Anaerolineae bacterium]